MRFSTSALALSLALAFSAALTSAPTLARAESACPAFSRSSGSLGMTPSPRGVLLAGIRAELSQRYDVRVHGLREIAAIGSERILFLFEHPALIDPVILYSETGDQFAPRPVVIASQATGFARGLLFRSINALIVPNVENDAREAAQTVARLNRQIIEGLASGDNIMMSPTGAVKRTHLEQLRNQRMAAEAIKSLPPGARVVVVTSKGLFGSSFSWGETGSSPRGPTLTGDLVLGLVTGSLQRRQVDLDFREISAGDLAELRGQSRGDINAYLARILNAVEAPNVYVPLRSCMPACNLPDPIQTQTKSPEEEAALRAATQAMPAEFRERVIAAVADALPEQRGVVLAAFAAEAATSLEGGTFSQRLGLDSLGYTELLLDVERRLGFPFGQVEEGSPSDFLLAAYRASIGGPAQATAAARPVDLRWFRYHEGTQFRQIPEGTSLTEVLFKKARENPDAPWMADEKSGVVTYREAVAKIMVLSRVIGRMNGEKIGIMLPPSVGAAIVFFATLEARKIPVMVNYTAGNQVLLASMENLNVRTILTAREMEAKLGERGLQVDAISSRFVYAEDLQRQLTERSIGNAFNLAMALLDRESARFTNLWPNGRLSGGDVAVILSTSGSSGDPKGVWLTHRNLLTNVRDVAPIFGLRQGDAVTGFIPFFHSLGLTGTLIMPALLGVRANYFANATDAYGISNGVFSFRSSLIVGPPNLLRQIFAAATPEQLASLRVIVTGAEALTPATYEFLRLRAPNAMILEGVGATEASPVWAISRPGEHQIGFVGELLPSVTGVVVDTDSLTEAIEKRDSSLIRVVEPDAHGVRVGEMVLSGDSVITSYYGGSKPEAFFQWSGRTFYRTEDLVELHANRQIRILGPLGRSHKAPGGEMINQLIVEALISQAPSLAPGSDGLPTFSVCATRMPDGENLTTVVTSNPAATLAEIVAFARAAGLGPTWLPRRLVHVDAIPVLGTGKTNARAAARMAAEALVRDGR